MFLLKLPMLNSKINDVSRVQQLDITSFKIFWTSYQIIKGMDNQGSDN